MGVVPLSLQAEDGGIDHAVGCVAGVLLSVLSKASLPAFDIVVNYGDQPIRRRPNLRFPHRAPQGRREDVPAPLFSLCASKGFWDIPLPRMCGIQCSHSKIMLLQ